MPGQITMPQLSDTMTEGTLIKWLKKEGDEVSEGDIVAEVETDKANMEMEAGEDGVIASILAQEGDKIGVGEPIAILALEGEDVEQVKSGGAATGKKQAAGGSQAGGGGADGGGAEAKAPAATAEGEEGAPGGKESHPSNEPADLKASQKAGAEGGQTRHTVAGDYGGPSQTEMPMPAANGTQTATAGGGAGGGDGGSGEGGRVKASPLARRMAENEGIDIARIDGTGPGGRIVQKDVLAFIDAGGAKQGGTSAAAQAKPAAATTGQAPKPAVQLPARVPSGQTEQVELSKMRQAIAKALQASKQNVPHFYETIDIDMEAANALRQKLIAAYEKSEGIRISIGDVVAKAVACALKTHPVLNSTFNGTTITRHGDVNLGMAVALPDGLIVPVLRHVDQMGFKEIRVRSADLVDRARKQKLKREEMSGATFTVSNLGTMGMREFSAIINPPEVGILAIGTAAKRPVVDEAGNIVARTTMTVTLSADHRVVDGADAARFLTTLKGMLEDPGMMLA
ncbi:MAG: dihydrolipoamide acetyltransferase family protein [Phycisphaerae bacterium]